MTEAGPGDAALPFSSRITWGLKAQELETLEHLVWGQLTFQWLTEILWRYYKDSAVREGQRDKLWRLFHPWSLVQSSTTSERSEESRRVFALAPSETLLVFLTTGNTFNRDFQYIVGNSESQQVELSPQVITHLMHRVCRETLNSKCCLLQFIWSQRCTWIRDEPATRCAPCKHHSCCVRVWSS